MSLLQSMLAANNSGGGAPITYVGGYTAGYVGTTTNITVPLTSLTGGIASSPSPTDLVVMYFTISPTTTISLPSPSNFVEVAQLYSSDTYNTKLYVGYKFAGSDTSITLVSGTWDGAFAGAVAVQVWRNVDLFSPLDVTATTATGANSALCNPPAITPITAGSVIIAGGAAGHNAATATFSSSQLSNFLSSGGSDTYDATVGMGSYNWVSGAFDPTAFTFSATNTSSYSWAAVTMALRKTQALGNVPYYVDFSSAAGANAATTLTINKPTATVAGDLMVALVCGDGNKGGTWTDTTGWTELIDKSGNPWTRVAYKIATSSEPASYTFTMSSQYTIPQGAIITYRNAAFDAVGTLSSVNTLSNTASVTTSVNTALVVGFSVTPSGTTITPQTGMNLRYSDFDASGIAACVADTYAPLGSVSKTFSQTSTISNFDAVLLSLKPA